MFPVPLNPRIAQLGKILQGIFHIPLSPIYIHHAYSNLYASALVADPYTFLFASLMVLIFGAGVISLDSRISKRLKEQA